MKSLLCLLCIVCASILSFGQTDGNFIEFLDGKKMELGTEEIRDVSGMFGGSSLKVGKTKYEAKLIKGYQSNG